jgi:hypothetical protein
LLKSKNARLKENVIGSGSSHNLQSDSLETQFIQLARPSEDQPARVTKQSLYFFCKLNPHHGGASRCRPGDSKQAGHAF